MAVELDLYCADPAFRDQAREAFREGDAGGFVISAKNPATALALVADNIKALQARGIYEECLLRAFTRGRVNHREWSESCLDCLFGIADPTRLRAAGRPLPGPGPFRIYRGVAGIGRARRLRGYSWTGCLDIACWFAARLDLPSPAVLTAEVETNHVLAYCGTSEQEFICKPNQWSRVKISSDELRAGSKRHHESTETQNKARLPSVLAEFALHPELTAEERAAIVLRHFS
jgi:hypothetical protein